MVLGAIGPVILNNKMVSVITGAESFIGKYISNLLITLNYKIRSFTNKSIDQRRGIEFHPYNFNNLEEVTKIFQGADYFFNTYWIRFNFKDKTFEKAYENTKSLIDCAKLAGVKKILHISITKANSLSPLKYFKYKGLIEEYIINSGVSYVILRPTVVFGKEDILINNIIWFLRRFPIFPIFGRGDYLIQPIYVLDLAKIAVEKALNSENSIIDCAGPEVFSFRELIQKIKSAIDSKSIIINLPTIIVFYLLKFLSFFLKDVILTKDEILALKGNLLHSKAPPLGKENLIEWIKKEKDCLGNGYRSELLRHYKSYGNFK